MGIGSYGMNTDRQRAIAIDCEGFDEWDYDEAPEAIKAELSRAFWPVNKWHGDHRAIAESNWLSVQICGHSDDIGLRVMIKDGTPAIAVNNMEAAARRLFKRLHEAGFALRVKTSGYTSAAYSPDIN